MLPLLSLEGLCLVCLCGMPLLMWHTIKGSTPPPPPPRPMVMGRQAETLHAAIRLWRHHVQIMNTWHDSRACNLGFFCLGVIFWYSWHYFLFSLFILLYYFPMICYLVIIYLFTHDLFIYFILPMISLYTGALFRSCLNLKGVFPKIIPFLPGYFCEVMMH